MTRRFFTVVPLSPLPDGETSGPGGRVRTLLYVLAILLVTAFAFRSLPSAGFVHYDDYIMVSQNPKIMSLSWASVGRFFTTAHYGLYHPLVLLSYALEYRLFGADPGVYHLTNLYLHLAASLLVFLLFSRLARDRRAGFLTALLFAVHPMHVESVAWVSERKDLLYAVFFLGSAAAFLSYADTGRLSRYLLSLLLFALSLLSKPMAVTLPLVFVLFAVTDRPRFSRVPARAFVPPFAAALVLAAVTLAVHYADGAGGSVIPGFAGRAAGVPANILFYLWKAVVPTGLSVIYPDPGAGWAGAGIGLAVALGVCAALAAAAAVSFRRRRTVAFGLLFFFVTLFPVLNLLPVGISAVADRYTYVPYLGLFYPAAVAFAGLLDRVRANRAAAAGLAALACGTVLVFAVLSERRALLWRGNLPLFEDAVRRYPDVSPVFYNGRGVAYLRRGRFAAAEREFRRALSIDGDYGSSFVNLAAVAELSGDTERALAYYRKAAATYHDRSLPHVKMAAIHQAAGDSAKALEECSAALARDPRDPEAFLIRASVLLSEGRVEAAAEACRAVLALRPDHPDALRLLAAVEVSRGDRAAAAVLFRRVLGRNPGDAAVCNSLGSTLAELGRTDEAAEWFDRAIALSPGLDVAWANRGSLRALAGDDLRALGDLTVALQLAPGDDDVRFKRAVLWFRRGRPDLARRDVARLSRPADPAFLEALAATSR